MVDVSQQLAFLVKEEIIRNVLKSHRRTLVLGLAGTGKTLCTLRAAAGIGPLWYFSAVPDSQAAAKSVLTIDILPALPSHMPENHAQAILIIDDLNRLAPAEIDTVTTLLKNQHEWFKIVLLSRMLIDSKELMPNIDVVVKMKDQTAEMMYSNLMIPEKS